MHLAQLNVGRLVAETDDPRVAEFMAALDRVNGLGRRMPGFVWMMEGSGEPGTGNTETKLEGDPRFVSNLTVWESVHHLIRALNEGETAAAILVAKLGGQAEAARELAYRLYTICERRKRAQEAQAYNGLVLSWPEIIRLAQ